MSPNDPIIDDTPNKITHPVNIKTTTGSSENLLAFINSLNKWFKK